MRLNFSAGCPLPLGIWRSGSRPLLRLAAIALMLFAIAGCGGDEDNPTAPPTGGGGPGPGPGPGTGGSGTFTAMVDGQAWTATASSLEAEVDANTPGTFLIEGTMSTRVMVVQIIFYNLAAPGTYPMGVGPTVFGAVGQVATSDGTSGKVWTTSNSGAAGTVTVTALTPTRIAGTFEFVADPSFGAGGTAPRTVTNGQFDLTLPGTALPTVPANAGSRVSANLDGLPWNAGTVIAQYASGGLTIGGRNDDYQVSIFLLSIPAGPGTYTLSDTDFLRFVDISPGDKGAPNGNCCWTLGTGITGTITVTSLTADRATGTFEVTLPPKTGTVATVPIEITAGTFDVGLY